MDKLRDNIKELNHDIEEINSLDSYSKAINIAFSLLAITSLIIDYITDSYVLLRMKVEFLIEMRPSLLVI